jgi:hypothetical protein
VQGLERTVPDVVVSHVAHPTFAGSGRRGPPRRRTGRARA